jgi:hypothetical protein
MKTPVRVFSDLHLGHKVSRLIRAESLRPLVSGAATAVFNGDTWQELAADFRPRAEELLGRLREICGEEGCTPVFLSGNHDPGWPGPGWLELADGRIIITHGDALLYGASPWKREILENPCAVDAIWHAHPSAATDAEERLRVAREIAARLRSVERPSGRTLLHRAWDAAIPPRRALIMLDAWFQQGRAGGAFCDRYFPGAAFLVIGHFHRAGSWLDRGRRIINTGSFMNPGRAHWVEWDGVFLKRGVIDETPGSCTIGEILDCWRA